MSHNYVNQFPIENFSLNNIQLAILILGLVEFILVNFLIDTKKVYNFFLGFQSSVESPLIRADDSKDQAETKGRDFAQDERVGKILKQGDIDIVLRSLEMSFNSEEANFQASLGENDLFNLFEEKNPSLDEVKQAFDVFDSNRDGFIDARELQKVLCALGLKEGLEMANCRRMIGVCDENEDGKIDYDEFVKFMETSFC
ncbi:probable calcium-binding protein cml45 [Phtheirospermum japonicum]|uniref:Probable calcium-binding protein cml45 n=1 Tax=Phtheirospermum japonicum TaxID=374723 RepID=A0A830C227_9LAMI|nr:probable calcium-binding protein cml45 [Phtheirospermum japonicum]